MVALLDYRVVAVYRIPYEIAKARNHRIRMLCLAAMSGWGHGLPCRRRSGMDGLPSIAEGRRPARVTRQLDPNYRTNPSGSWHGRMCHFRTHAPQRRAVLIRSRRRRGRASAWYLQPKRLSCPKVYRRFIPGRRLHRKVGRISAVQDAVDIGCDLPILMQDVCAAGHETTGHDKRTVCVNWQLVPSNRCACRGNTGAEVPGKVWG